MSLSNNIKVIGYAKRTFFNNGIEYRNFSPDLVGLNLTNPNENSTFTFGNFVVINSNIDRNIINYNTNKLSNFYNLNNIGTDNIDLIEDNNVLEVKLNLDLSNLDYSAYFGSLKEFIRVSLENIITKWPGSLYVTSYDINSNEINLIFNYEYDNQKNTAKFLLNINGIENNFGLIFNQTGYNFNNTKLRNFTTNFSKYQLSYKNKKYDIINYVPPLENINGFMELEVIGNPFNQNDLNSLISFHIKPNDIEIEKFFNKLSNFENYLLNRNTTPKYTSIFKFKTITNSGVEYSSEKKFTWTTSDGYNIDFENQNYINYVNQLIKLSEDKDSIKTNIIERMLVSKSISDFDTIPDCDGINQLRNEGQKINKLLKIYGRNFDDIKKYIDGIKFSSVVSYNKKNNTPDILLRNIARNLGWELTSSLFSVNFVNYVLNVNKPSYLGQSKGLNLLETENEIYRRLILNSAWLWKSKGTRKTIEFILKFLGIPNELINFNEFIYISENKININIFLKILEQLGLTTNLENYSVDNQGYPKPLLNNNELYFQKAGLWYEETSGLRGSLYTEIGNNPHIGPYDGGNEYLNQFINLIPNFEPVTITSGITTSSSVNLFTNYNNGIMNNYSGDTYISIENNDNILFDDCYVYESEIIIDPYPESTLTNCGCELPEDDLALHISVSKFESDLSCDEEINGFEIYENDNIEFYNWGTSNEICGNISTLSIDINDTFNVLATENSVFRLELLVPSGVELTFKVNISGNIIYEINIIGDNEFYFYDIQLEGIENVQLFTLLFESEQTFSELYCVKQGTLINNYNINVPLNTYKWDFKTFNFDGTENTNIENKSLYISEVCCNELVNGRSFSYDEYEIIGEQQILTNTGKICCSETTITNDGEIGCGCYITCKWKLAGPQQSDMYLAPNGDRFLKFVTPKNNWGTSGQPEYKVVSKADSCFCPLEYTTPELIIDPFTNEQGYGCKLNRNGDLLLLLESTFFEEPFNIIKIDGQLGNWRITLNNEHNYEVGDLVLINLNNNPFNLNDSIQIINIYNSNSFDISGNEISSDEFEDYINNNSGNNDITGLVSRIININGTTDGILYKYYENKALGKIDCFNKNI